MDIINMFSFSLLFFFIDLSKVYIMKVRYILIELVIFIGGAHLL